jgi:hypothetical protein
VIGQFLSFPHDEKLLPPRLEIDHKVLLINPGKERGKKQPAAGHDHLLNFPSIVARRRLIDNASS